jgi:ribosomal protein S18 acetylase RimI-like enzyme
MEEEITIRPFQARDQAKAEALILNGLAEHFEKIDPVLNPDLRNIKKSYLNQGSLFLVADSNGDLVGSGALIAEAEDTGRIVRVSVARAHRRLGIGRLLTEELITAACGLRFKQIVVETNDDWHDAIRLYQHCGFTEYDRRDGELHLKLML